MTRKSQFLIGVLTLCNIASAGAQTPDEANTINTRYYKIHDKADAAGGFEKAIVAAVAAGLDAEDRDRLVASLERGADNETPPRNIKASAYDNHGDRARARKVYRRAAAEARVRAAAEARVRPAGKPQPAGQGRSGRALVCLPYVARGRA